MERSTAPRDAGQRESRSGDFERPWLKHYPEGVPPEVQIPPITLVDQLEQTARAYPNHHVAVFYGYRMTYRELDERSSQFANRLIELGLMPGQPVLLLLPNLPQFLVVAYGTLKAGGVIAAVSPLLTEGEVAKLAENSGARIAVTLDRFWPAVEPLLERGEIDAAIVTGVQDGLPFLKRMLYPLKYRRDIVRVDHDPGRGRYQFRELMKGALSASPNIAIASNHVAVFQYTGGTTGLPRAAVLTHRNLIANSLQVRTWIPQLREGDERIMAILPFFHAYGGTLCLFLAVKLAATLIIVPRFDLKDVMEQIEKYRPTVLPGVPTLYNALTGGARDNPQRQEALRSIRYCVSGGAPLPPEVQQRFEEVTGARLVEGYGLSEASPVTHVNPLDGRARSGTIGLPLPSTDARVVDLETREPLPPGKRGELAIRGPQVMLGYWRASEETAEALSSDGWLYTGDIAEMDEEGFFRVVDRQKDVIITAGENIYPREIEEALYEHPKIQEVAVAGIQHELGGQIAKAYVVLKPDETMDRAELLQWCQDRLAKYKIPRQVEFRRTLPKSPAGKVLRRVLQEQEAARRASSE